MPYTWMAFTTMTAPALEGKTPRRDQGGLRRCCGRTSRARWRDPAGRCLLRHRQGGRLRAVQGPRRLEGDQENQQQDRRNRHHEDARRRSGRGSAGDGSGVTRGTDAADERRSRRVVSSRTQGGVGLVRQAADRRVALRGGACIPCGERGSSIEPRRGVGDTCRRVDELASLAERAQREGEVSSPVRGGLNGARPPDVEQFVGVRPSAVRWPAATSTRAARASAGNNACGYRTSRPSST